jgi:hypothetical protein
MLKAILFQTIRVFQHQYGNILKKNDVDVPKKIKEHCCGLVPPSIQVSLGYFFQGAKKKLPIGVAF